MRKLSANKKPELNIPNFKSEDEEAAWWEANADYIFERMKKYGRIAGPLHLKRGSTLPTKAISIRISVDDLERVQAIAKQKGVPYQTFIKDLIHKAVQPKSMTGKG
jgi:predicted DNA binding CopG/RHH family protein